MPRARTEAAAPRESFRRLEAVPRVRLWRPPSPVEEMPRLRAALGGGPRLLVKRDDAIPFAFGGNKVRKLEPVLAEALAAGADTLVTIGSVQSNHARVTAAAAARLGLHCHVVCDGEAAGPPTGNARLRALLGADVEHVATRAARASGMEAALERLRAEGLSPFPVPLGASTAGGASGFVRAVDELLEQVSAPDVIVHAASSGGTQAGLLAGCALHGLATRVVGVTADEPAAEVRARVGDLLEGLAGLLDLPDGVLPAPEDVRVEEGFIGGGYGEPTPGSEEAQRLAARTEALFVDHTYTAKGLAALISLVRRGHVREGETVLFWHTGGQVGLLG